MNNTSSFKKSQLQFIRGNICDKYLVSEIFEKFQIDGVINFAAESHVDNSIENPSPFIETNINGVFNLLNIAFKSWNDGPFNVRKNLDMLNFIKFPQMRFLVQLKMEVVRSQINSNRTLHILQAKRQVIC